MLKTNSYTISPKIFTTSNVFFGGSKNAKSGILLGKIAEQGTGDFAWLDDTKEHVVAILGKRGSGKSHTLGVLSEIFALPSDRIYKREKERAAILLDTLGIYWTTKYKPDSSMRHAAIAKQLEELEQWNLQSTASPSVEVYVPAGFEAGSDPQGTRTFSISIPRMSPDDWAFLLGIDPFRDPMGQLLNVTYSKVVEEGWFDTRSDTDVNSSVNYGLEDLVNCISYDRELISPELGFDVRTRRALISKLNSSQRFAVFARQGTPIEDLLRPSSLSIILLSNVPDSIRSVIASVLFRTILEIRREESILAKREAVGEHVSHIARVPPVWIMIDEAQNISPSESMLISSPVLVKLVREGRNFGISVALTTQQPTAIDQRIMAQVDTLIVHKLSVKKDIDAIESNAKTSHPKSVHIANQELEFDDLIRKMPVGFALVSNTDTDREFVVQVRPRVTVHGGFEP